MSNFEYETFGDMVYSAKPSRSVLAKGVYRNVPFYVLSLGTHPCAYVNIQGVIDSININDIECNGGITYSEKDLLLSGSWENGEIITGWFLGWDYTHAWDFSGYYLDNPGFMNLNRHNVKEMIEDCTKAIDQVLSYVEKEK